MTITNDDALAAFVLGGTVSGLEGDGLVLRINFFDDVSATNGAFVFLRGPIAGAAYQVSVLSQPSNPNQLCTVVNGSGVMPEDDVLNVVVECATAAPNQNLDPTFGNAGVVTTPGIRGAQAVALQADGRIITAGDNSLARYLPDGTPDIGFGTNGAVVTGLDAAFLGDATDVALQRPPLSGRKNDCL